jgi:hypothetical protein
MAADKTYSDLVRALEAIRDSIDKNFAQFNLETVLLFSSCI